MLDLDVSRFSRMGGQGRTRTQDSEDRGLTQTLLYCRSTQGKTNYLQLSSTGARNASSKTKPRLSRAASRRDGLKQTEGSHTRKSGGWGTSGEHR